MQDLIQNLFNESIQTQVSSADSMGPAVLTAVNYLSEALLQGQKLLICGDDSNHFVAAHFTKLLLHGSTLERPPFAATHLRGFAYSTHAKECLARQVTALGHKNDVLIVFITQSENERLHHAMVAAVAREMRIIMIAGNEPGEAASLLGPGDIEIRIPSDTRARIVEQQLFLTQVFCDTIEARIFKGVA